MNRRGLFSFLAGAPLGVAAAVASAKVEAKPADNVVRASEHRCHCGSPMWHLVPDYSHAHTMMLGVSSPDHTHTIVAPARAVCTWCSAPWHGRTA